jgi:hypothetical protein
MFKVLICVAAAAGFVALGACSEGSSEKAGEELDSAIEKATQGEKDLGDGPFEKAGESIDKATGAANPDAADSLSDAADADKSTKPD